VLKYTPVTSTWTATKLATPSGYSAIGIQVAMTEDARFIATIGYTKRGMGAVLFSFRASHSHVLCRARKPSRPPFADKVILFERTSAGTYTWLSHIPTPTVAVAVDPTLALSLRHRCVEPPPLCMLLSAARLVPPFSLRIVLADLTAPVLLLSTTAFLLLAQTHLHQTLSSAGHKLRAW